MNMAIIVIGIAIVLIILGFLAYAMLAGTDDDTEQTT